MSLPSYRLRGAYVSSWGPLDDERGRRSSAIDTMVNLPLPYRAADRTDGERWGRHGLAMLECLCGDYLVRDDARRGLLKHGRYSMPHKDGVDSAVMFGDYFFVEALFSALAPGAFLPAPRPL